MAKHKQWEAHHPEGDMRSRIEFYIEKGTYGPFSNYSPDSVTVDDKEYPTTEHYFQAMKFITTDASYAEKVRLADTPGAAKRLGQKGKLRYDWEDVKEGIMMIALRAKFTQHEKLRRLLLGTGESYLVEHTKNDSYWGDGGNGLGYNRLGLSLMKVRRELSREAGRHEWDEGERLLEDAIDSILWQHRTQDVTKHRMRQIANFILEGPTGVDAQMTVRLSSQFPEARALMSLSGFAVDVDGNAVDATEAEGGSVEFRQLAHDKLNQLMDLMNP
eukprot:GFYU01000454.1.p1 GENE.GFYU01000454.1~~GFYU01000454.1.p1  ORF type:complete len:311 (-),score=67.96 GFYU01000454.1:59-877(-)